MTATPRFVRLREPDWTFDPAELEAAFSNRTRAIVVNTPNNPTGKVFIGAELEAIAALCRKWDVTCITDEIYEHIVFEGEHVSMATLEGMRERTVTISGLSKTWSVTGWRIGWCLAPPEATNEADAELDPARALQVESDGALVGIEHGERQRGAAADGCRHSPAPSARCTTSSRSARPRRCRKPPPSRSRCRTTTTAVSPRATAKSGRISYPRSPITASGLSPRGARTTA